MILSHRCCFVRMFPLPTDSSLYYRFVNGPSLSGLLILCKVRGSEVGDGMPKAVQRSTGEKNLNAYHNRAEGQGQRKRVRAKGPEDANSSRQLHPWWGESSVSKVDLLGVWRILLHGAVRAFQPEEDKSQGVTIFEFFYPTFVPFSEPLAFYFLTAITILFRNKSFGKAVTEITVNIRLSM